MGAIKRNSGSFNSFSHSLVWVFLLVQGIGKGLGFSIRVLGLL